MSRSTYFRLRGTHGEDHRSRCVGIQPQEGRDALGGWIVVLAAFHRVCGKHIIKKRLQVVFREFRDFGSSGIHTVV